MVLRVSQVKAVEVCDVQKEVASTVLDLTCYDIVCLLEVHELCTEDDGEPTFGMASYSRRIGHYMSSSKNCFRQRYFIDNQSSIGFLYL